MPCSQFVPSASTEHAMLPHCCGTSVSPQQLPLLTASSPCSNLSQSFSWTHDELCATAPGSEGDKVTATFRIIAAFCPRPDALSPEAIGVDTARSGAYCTLSGACCYSSPA